MKEEKKKETGFKGFLVEVAPQSNLLQTTRVRVRSKTEVMNLQRNRYEILRFLEGSFEELPDGEEFGKEISPRKRRRGFF